MTMLDTSELLNPREAAERIGVAHDTFTAYVSRGKGPTVTDVRGYKLFKRADVDAWHAARPGRGARTDLA